MSSAFKPGQQYTFTFNYKQKEYSIADNAQAQLLLHAMSSGLWKTYINTQKKN